MGYLAGQTADRTQREYSTGSPSGELDAEDGTEHSSAAGDAGRLARAVAGPYETPSRPVAEKYGA